MLSHWHQSNMSKNLFWEKLESLNFETVKNELLYKGWSAQDVKLGLHYYKLFLYIKYIHPAIILVPPPIVDLTWHTHIMVDLSQYIQDCECLFGYLLNHCSTVGFYQDYQKTLETAFWKTKVFFKEFGVDFLEQEYTSDDIACVDLPFRTTLR
ncbi:MAG: hypothetical protein AAGG00_10120 [Cyanobacteria bacterium P01_H01_bin.150]